MIVNVKFADDNQGFSLAFGSTQTADDGGYERGYSEAIDAVVGGSLDALVSDSLLNVRQYAFYNAKSVKSISLPNAKTVGQYAFYSSGVESASMAVCETIASNAFDNCDYLREVNCQNVTAINSYAFRSCESLEQIKLPNAETVGAYAFNSCTKLIAADLGNAKSLASLTFASCSKLKALVLRGNQICSIAANTLNATAIKNGTGYVYVPRSLVDAYKIAANWSAYAAQIRPLEDYTVDGTTAGDLDPGKI